MTRASILTAVFCLGFAPLGAVMAQKMKENPNCKQWHSVIGTWTGEVEYRDSPTAQWKKGPRGTNRIEWVLDGAAIQMSGNDDKTSRIGIFVYENRLDAHVGGGYSSDGSRFVLNAGNWDGLNWTGNWTSYPSSGKAFIGHCTFNYESDFTSATAECQQFTNGQWWTNRKVKVTKAK